MQTLKVGSTGPDVRALQAAITQRARGRGLPTVEVDGQYGKLTDAAAAQSARALGALESTIAKTGTSVGEQRMIRWPLTRSPAQYARARGRAKARKAREAAVGKGPQAALAFLRRYVGKTESPPGSNKAPWGLTAWQQALGSWLVGQAWCGTGAGTALIRAGVKGITSRVASVFLILDDALNGRNGFKSCVYRRRTGLGSVTAGKPGDLVGLFGESTHVETIVKRVPGGYDTIGCNTGPPSGSGSQADGGGCWPRTRPDSAVVYIARPRYPEA